MNMIDFWLLLTLLSIFSFMIIMFFIAIVLKNNSIIDICWSLNFLLAALLAFLLNGFLNKAFLIHQLLIIAFLMIWGLRLSIHIARRNIGRGEDIRYKKRREAWKKGFYIKSFFLIFMLQALWAAIIVSPIVFSNSIYIEPDSGTYDFFTYPYKFEIIPLTIGSLVWIIGFYFEAIGDRQLRKFLKNPVNKGKIIQSGLWRYTRHPNYFGEITMAWGLFIMAISLVIIEPLTNSWIFITIIGPIMYTLLIRYVTGVPENEKFMITLPGYKEYMARTSVLFPWIPKR